jgi:hypothetical protein
MLFTRQSTLTLLDWAIQQDKNEQKEFTEFLDKQVGKGETVTNVKMEILIRDFISRNK